MKEPIQPPPIYIVTGGAGDSGKRLINTILVQFPGSNIPVIAATYQRRRKQIADVVKKVAETGGIVVHTLVDTEMRDYLLQLTREYQISSVDLMGPLIECVSEMIGQPPAGNPGLYRRLHKNYFERVEAIEYTIKHDDGKNPQGWADADIVLTGISRVGKTPLGMYLAVHGWKVANVPLVFELPAPKELFQLDRMRVIALTIDPGQLVHHRKKRQRRLGTGRQSPYADPLNIFEEVEYAKKIFKRGGFSTINVTDKPIESSADEIVELITRRFPAIIED